MKTKTWVISALILIVLFLVSSCNLTGEAKNPITAPSAANEPLEKATSHEHYIYGANLEAKYDEDGLQYYHQDVLGSTRRTTDTSGNLIEANTHLPYGQLLGASSERFGFTGKESEGNLAYYGARYYDTDTGRFTQKDPIADGKNWYGYANNNPLKYVDPSGTRIAVPENQRNEILGLFDLLVGKGYLHLTQEDGRYFINGIEDYGGDYPLTYSKIMEVIEDPEIVNINLMEEGETYLYYYHDLESENPSSRFVKTNSFRREGGGEFRPRLRIRKDEPNLIWKTFSGENEIYVKHPTGNQRFGVYTQHVIMHELGHAWGYLNGYFYDDIKEGTLTDFNGQVSIYSIGVGGYFENIGLIEQGTGMVTGYGIPMLFENDDDREFFLNWLYNQEEIIQSNDREFLRTFQP
ncbi:MAG: RHS repeat-associated core domain-containing protein [archaeon]